TITREQAVADRAEKLAETAGKRQAAQERRAAGELDPLTENLQTAARAAARAAKSALDGNGARSGAARAEARRALEQAVDAASREAQAAAAAPADKADWAAQKKVSDLAAAALAAASGLGPQSSLETAAKSSAEAHRHAKSDDKKKAAAAQAHTETSLREAGEQIKSDLNKLAKEQRKQLAKQARKAKELADLAAPVDPAALSALRDAQTQAAEESKDREPDDADDDTTRASRAQNQAQQDFDRAAASLNARQQRVQRDKAIAEAVRSLAKRQQDAVEEIFRHSADLLKQPEDPTEPPIPPPDLSPRDDVLPEGMPTAKSQVYLQQQQAAQALNQARRDFAQAQRGTGEAAEEISCQSQIANRPLREAMELASNLPADDLPQSTGAFSRGSQKLNPSAEGDEPGPGSGKEQGAGHREKSESKHAGPASKRRGSGTAAKGASRRAEDGKTAQTDLGTRFVPNSPETTAKMIAGSQAASRAAALVGGDDISERAEDNSGIESDGLPMPDERAAEDDAADSDAPTSDAPAASESSETSKSSSGGNSRAARASRGPGERRRRSRPNDELKQGPPSFAGRSGASGSNSRADGPPHDAASGGEGPHNDEAWIAKLPPDLRKAIRAKAQRPPPKSYEEKLQKYFESID
ncbi:MAG TPA: hypothetical protein VKU82_15085, partial [Planctomycetaceae bacterium]|nr:hypothetical protein [Planctomycetaceae bacterium]